MFIPKYLLFYVFILLSRLSEAEFLRLAEVNIAALNAATASLPPDKVKSLLELSTGIR